MGVLSNKIERKQLKRGDHIYSWRQAYLFAHHGIYVNEQVVIHFTTGTPTSVNSLFTSSAPSFDTNNIPCPICGDRSKTRTKNGVFSSCLDCFLSGGELCRFLYGVNKLHFLVQARGGTCTLASSDPTDEVIYRAIYLLENGFGDYHVSKNNCENFAMYCKTGLQVITNDSVGGGSGQATSYLAAAKSVVFSSIPVVASYYSPALVGCLWYSRKRLISDIGYRKDVTIKVPVERISEMARREN
ncbi:protein LEAD-SENSITIVE 1-like [Vicia villosa]|uniref:protein LEAD-SENSITIVE 1-like n=1 Tax=Vicia villosa TaxID=3911 RepID=UPI00273B98EB|nr:protein LEAD-SENSITIVE 1-like [Vicia villosa]